MLKNTLIGFILISMFTGINGCSSHYNFPPTVDSYESVALPPGADDSIYVINPRTEQDAKIAALEQRVQKLMRVNTTISPLSPAVTSPSSEGTITTASKKKPSSTDTNNVEQRLLAVEETARRNGEEHQELKNRVGILETKVDYTHPDIEVLTNNQGFASGSWELTDQDKKNLDAIREDLEKTGKIITTIIGVTDTSGNLKDNRKIAAERALSVLAYFTKNKTVTNPQTVDIKTELSSNRFCNNRRWLIIAEGEKK